MTGRRLSSSLTFFWKVVLPVAWIAGFVLCAASVFFVSRGKAPDPLLQSLKWAFLLVSLVGAPTLLWFATGLKQVTRDGPDLLVSNYRRELRIPVGEIRHVYQSWAVTPWRVVIDMRSPTELGSTFVAIDRNPVALPGCVRIECVAEGHVTRVVHDHR